MNPKLARWTLAAVAAAGLAWLLYCAPRGGGLAPGAQAPDFRLSDLAGRPISLSDLRGRVVLVDFWATWCGTCAEEIPALKDLYGRYRGAEFELLAAAVDQGDSSEVALFARSNGLPYPVLLADYATARAYGVSGIPTKYLIDRAGVVRRRYYGETDPSTLAADIDALLGRKP
ncbi:MAG: TlpA disulfide reductase family protein [Elusimicrobiota bacterium]|jgi:peroxiredoxin